MNEILEKYSKFGINLPHSFKFGDILKRFKKDFKNIDEEPNTSQAGTYVTMKIDTKNPINKNI